MTDVITNPLADAGTAYPMRVLIVADGPIHFKPQSGGFALSELVAALKEPVKSWEDPLIKTARRGDVDVDCCPDFKNFVFDSESFNIEKYDEVWLFGRVNEEDSTQFMKPSEVKCLNDFMNQGGGVFATGDHEGLGFALCGEVPRVQSMRKWRYTTALPGGKAPGRDDDTRIDTLREGVTAGFQDTDESDSVAQEIRPKFYPNAGGTASYPHPLLADRDSAITVLPDHMHEGECILPENLTNSFAFDGGESFDEYPLWRNSTERSRPDLVAISTSAAGSFTELTTTHPPVEPKCFKIIVAYDGHLVAHPHADDAGVRIGRVVVDSSFHHFLDFNLKGFKGADGQLNKDFVAFKKYYRNIMSWLYPARRRREYYMALLLRVRFSGNLMAELPTKPTFSLEEILRAGSLARQAIAATVSAGEAIACALAMLVNVPIGLRTEIERLINPWLPKQLRALAINPLLNVEFFLNLILGIAILNISAGLPTDMFAAAKDLAGSNVLAAEISPRISDAIESRFDSLLEVVRLSQTALASF